MSKKLQKDGNLVGDYRSSDIGLISFLLCLGYELIELDRSGGSKVVFIIRRDDHLDEAIKGYWNFKAPCDAQTYFNQLKRLKNQLYNPN